MLDSQKHQGLASELLDKQVAEFSKSKGLSEDLMKVLMLKMTEERKARRNAERMILGKKFKAVVATRDRRGRPRKHRASHSTDSEP